MGTARGPVTSAVRVLRAAGVEYTEHLYDYEEHGGTRVSARELGVDEHSVVKTIVMQDEHKQPLIALMHGDMNVSAKTLGRCIGAKTIEPCDPAVAQRHTGYMVGGTSPFGTRRSMPVFLQQTIVDLPRIYINGGKRGFLVGIAPQVLLDLLAPTCVDIAAPRE